MSFLRLEIKSNPTTLLISIKPISLSVIIVVLMSCQRIVEIETPFPEKARFCSVSDDLIGLWQSDSVWVLTKIDSLDSIVINTRPTFYYELNVQCDQDTVFDLKYINYSGVVSREVYSINYESNDSVFLIYDELDFDREPASATFLMPYEHTSDSSFRASYLQDLNADQRTEIILWMRRR